MRQTLLLLFLALILMPDTINALPFKEISTDNGLSNRRVQESILDDNGYIWFATRSGIDRYNGEFFVHYTLSISAENEVTEHPRGILINDQKEIYAFSEANIYKFSYETDSFHQVNNVNLTQREAINAITFDPTGHLWIGTTNIYTDSIQTIPPCNPSNRKWLFTACFSKKKNMVGQEHPKGFSTLSNRRMKVIYPEGRNIFPHSTINGYNHCITTH